MIDSNLSHLCPDLQTIASRWLAGCAAAGLTVKITVTWRNPADQDAAYNSGLSNARAGQSPHNITLPDGTPYAMAWDFAVFDNTGAYITNGEDHRYAQAAAIAKNLGLAWGGDWIHIKDYDHCELQNWKQLALNLQTDSQPDSIDV